VELEDMIHIATKVERQLKRKWHIRPAFNLGSSSLYKLDLKRKGVAQTKHFIPTKVEPLKAKVKVSTSFKGKSETQPKHTRDVKCFRY
jgi:hypothetical protein